jgi:hypothetical protein
LLPILHTRGVQLLDAATFLVSAALIMLLPSQNRDSRSVCCWPASRSAAPGTSSPDWPGPLAAALTYLLGGLLSDLTTPRITFLVAGAGGILV